MGVVGQRHAPANLPLERPSTQFIGVWVGPRAGLGRCRKSHPHWDLIPRLSSPFPVAILTALSQPMRFIDTKLF
jgi:hypothetical protein